MHGLTRQINLRTIRVKGQIGNQYVQVLIDSSSTHNFIQEWVTLQLRLSITPFKQFKVYVGNEDFLTCDSSFLQVKLSLQGHKFCVDLFILPI